MRRLKRTLLGLVLLNLAEFTARYAGAQTLQLPTFHYFATDSSVLVPDRGAVTLGGVGRSSSAGNQFGPLRGGRASVSATSAGGASASAFVHDFEAMDQAVLAKAARLRQESAAGSDALPAEGDSTGLESVADIRRRQAVEPNLPQNETGDYLARARAAVACGKPNVARVYLQMAERRSTGAQKAAIRAELAALQPAAHASTQSSPRNSKK